MTPEIHGIMPVMITPFTEDNAIDYAGLEREKWSIVVYLSRLDQAAIFSMLSCTPSLNTTPSMT